MQQSDYLDLVKKKFDIEQDLDLEKHLKVRASTICRYRSGKAQFGPATAMKIAEILKIPPENIAADMMAARSTNKKLMKKWMERGALVSLMFSAVVLSPITTNGAQAMESFDNLYIMRS